MTSFDQDYRERPVQEFDDWAELFLQLGVADSPAELHGVLVGSLVAGRRMTPMEWMRVVTEHLGTEVLNAEFDQLRRQFDGLYKEWERVLQQDALGFRPLLPEDDVSLGERLESVGAWCQGFVEGFSLGLPGAHPALADDTRELLSDLMAIAEIDPVVDASEEQEHDYMQLVEFIRVAAINLFAEFNAPPTAPPGTSVH